MDTSNIENLLQIKKKSDASKADKESFLNEWLSYVKENNFDDSAQSFLLNGFSFLGVEPLIAYLLEIDDRDELLEELFKGKHLYKNKSTAFKAVLNALALTMLKLPDEKNMIALLVKKLPSLSTNKTGAPLKDISKIVNKYFIQTLSPNTTLPNLDSLDLKQPIIELFRKTMTKPIKDLINEGNCSQEDLSIIANIEKWLSAPESKIIKSDVLEKADPEKSNQKSLPVTSVETPDQGKAELEKPKTDKKKTAIWSENLRTITNAVSQFEKEYLKLQAKYENRKHDISKLEFERLNLQSLLRIKNETCARQENEINLFSKQITSLQQEIALLEKDIKDKEHEIEQRIKFSEMIGKDRSKQFDEKLKRLASQINVEYRDFIDAEDLPMNHDLGENMRLQLKSVFDILKKNGFDLK